MALTNIRSEEKRYCHEKEERPGAWNTEGSEGFRYGMRSLSDLEKKAQNKREKRENTSHLKREG